MMGYSTLSNRQIRLIPSVIMLLSAVAALMSYLQALHYTFILDDIGYILWNNKLAGLKATELWRLFTGPYNDYSEFLPLRDLSYWFDLSMFGQNPAAFRLHNILLYLLCLPLVFYTSLNLWRHFRPQDTSSAPFAAAAVTALFALHPAHVETVVWISDRKYVLADLFSVLAFWLAASVKREHGLSAPHAVTVMLAFVAVMLSKSSYVTVAPVISLLWIIFWLDTAKQERHRSMVLWSIGMLLLTASLILIFIFSGKEYISMSGGMVPVFGFETVTRSLAALGWLARLVVSGESRHMYYPVIEYPHLSAMIALGGVILSAGMAGLVMVLRRPSLEGFTLVAFFLLCAPYLQLVPYAPPSLVSDRFLSLAVWPLILFIVALAWRLKPSLRTILLLIIAMSWGYQTSERPRDWRNFETLVDADLRNYPGYYMPAVYKITSFMLPRGEIQQASELAKGITNPDVRNIMTGIIKIHDGNELDVTGAGKLQGAMDQLWKLGKDIKQLPVQAKLDTALSNLWIRLPYLLAVEWKYLDLLYPDNVSLRYNAGLWMLDAQRYKDAVDYLRGAATSPDLPKKLRGKAYASMGIALLGSGNTADAEAPLRAALEQSPPELRAYCSLSDLYKQTGRIEEAALAQTACPVQ